MKKIDISKIKHTFAGGGAILTNRKHVLITILVFLEFLLISFGYISYGNKNLDKYIIGKSTSDSSLFAIMLEDSNGEYKQSSTSTFPGYEYFYNQSKSGCMNNSGKQIKDSLLYDQDNKKATVNVSETSMCYLYFDKYKSTSFSDELIASNTLWQSGLEGDGYRFTGTGIKCTYNNGAYTTYAYSCPTLYNYTRTKISDSTTATYTYQTSCPSNTSYYTYSCTELTATVDSSSVPKNFICFGTTDKNTCTSNPSTYMYRIIGVFADENEDNHIKLIKYTQLSSEYEWHSSYTTDTDWADSTLYAGLNGSYFLTNTTYSYMQDNTWLSKITDWKWSAVNTKTYEDQTNNPSYYYTTGKGIYLHEMNKGTSSDTSCTNNNKTAINCLGGSWTTPTAKIGLMYVSDYALSLGQAALSYTSLSNASTLKTGWMYQSNNDTTASEEWTISRYGEFSSNWYAWDVNADGTVNVNCVDSEYGSRAVFYLESDVTAVGTGTLESPYMITDDSGTTTPLKVSLSNSGSTLNATITKGTGNLNKYCINTSSSITNCTWNNITSTSISYTMPSEGTYYVHVIDDAGYIAHSSLTYAEQSWGLAKDLINSGTLWQSGLEGDGYRFTGSGEVGDSTNPNNFICFGTTDIDECREIPEIFMYRIIGVFADEKGNNHVKLIKLAQLGAYAWHSDGTVDADWEDSDLYKGLNGSYFLTNSTYSYMQDNIWLNKITDWKWSAVNTLTGESDGLIYEFITGQNIYLHEMNRTGKTSTIGEWTTPTAKIGLMYTSDYALSLGEEALSYTSPSNYSTLKTGWMHQSNNDTTASAEEWTISRIGDSGPDASNFGAWFVATDGPVTVERVLNTFGTRPVLYLESDISGSGEGTLEDPIMIN